MVHHWKLPIGSLKAVTWPVCNHDHHHRLEHINLSYRILSPGKLWFSTVFPMGFHVQPTCFPLFFFSWFRFFQFFSAVLPRFCPVFATLFSTSYSPRARMPSRRRGSGVSTARRRCRRCGENFPLRMIGIITGNYWWILLIFFGQ